MGKDDPLRLHFFGSRPSRHLAVYVHGWATDRTSRGLFTALANHLAGLQIGSILFDLNDYDETGNVLFRSLSQQTERLQQAVDQAHAMHPGASLSLIGHSLGCVTAARWLQEKQPDLEKLVLLAPAAGEPAKQLRRYLNRRPDSRIDGGGQLSFTRKNGTMVTLATGYLEELDFDLLRLYRQSLSSRLGQTKIIIAEEDWRRQTPEQQSAFNELGAKILKGADHNFIRRLPELCQMVTRTFGRTDGSE